MNRIVIVGNGFDLAHGLKARYEDFVVDLLKNAITKAYEKFEKPDVLEPRVDRFLYMHEDLLTIQMYHNQFDINTLIKFDTVNQYIDSKHFSLSHNPLNSTNIVINYNNFFFKELLHKSNWTDIEHAYFTFLVKLKDNLEDVKKLNTDFEKIKELFIKYLQKETKDKFITTKPFNSLIEDKISGGIYGYYNNFIKNRIKSVLEIEEGESEPKINHIFYINFNYTNILQRILSECSFRKHNNHITYIHGQLTISKNIIFGYGDEMNEHYKVLESTGNDELLKHFKSHYYGAQSNYPALLGIIEEDQFDVVVIGHSLGLSDRLLLNTIFEHDNCKFIHLVHNGEDSHFKKRIAISRHFNDKKLLRSRLLEYNKDLNIPR